MQPKPHPDVIQSERAMSVLATSLLIGCLVVPLFAAQSSNLGQFASVAGVAFVIAASSLLCGGLLGFLFGIPRTLQQEAGSSAKADGQVKSSAADASSETTYAVNTNLEQISDWLTKILVGVGLTQISKLPDALGSYSTFVRPALGDNASSGVFAVALLLFFLIDGFLISYLWTRLHLAGALRQADATSRLLAVEAKLDSIDIDAKSWSLAQRVLSPAEGSAPVSQQDINQAILDATPSMRAQIYRAAVQLRSDSLGSAEEKPKIERTIPIFRALIVSDTDHVFHANHGQLGFALKDKPEPEWGGALSELTEAIRLCVDPKAKSWLPYYRLARAECRIHLDEGWSAGEPSAQTAKQEISEDLQSAFSRADAAKWAQDDEAIKRWMELNKMAVPKRASRAAGAPA